ncbi:MAG: hypothetical protein FWH18_00890 [Marinilabiliaceae bacterium]|nr:hypothetical protein [Marinilabiliaceae bacterium]
MRKNKIKFMVIIALITVQISYGQREYSELYKSLPSKTNFEAYWELYQYLQKTTSKEYVNSNAYYQIGLILQKSMRETDPFLETWIVENHINQAKLYLSLAKMHVDDQQVRQQSAYYPTIKPAGQRLTADDVKKDIDLRIAEIEDFYLNFNESLLYLTKCVNSYNQCIITFAEINHENNRLNDLYFLKNDLIEEKLTTLSENFDSTIYYLDKFKTLLERYPMGNYKISYSLKLIDVYRLSGLNSTNFLSDNFTIWDFKTWIKDFLNITDTDVEFLYQSVDETNKINTAHIQNLLRMKTDGVQPDYSMNPLVINKILKYDYNSAAASLLNYQESKIHYLYSIIDNQPTVRVTTFDIFTKSRDAFLSIIQEKLKTDHLLNDAKTKSTPEAIQKYEKFYDNNYGGYTGYQRYLSGETLENEMVLNNALKGYKDNILQLHTPSDDSKKIIYRNEPISLQIIFPVDLPAQKRYWIHAKQPMNDNAMFIAGTHSIDRRQVAFVAMIDSMGTVKWLKELPQGNHAILTAVLNDEFAVIVSSPFDNMVKNKMILLDKMGNVKNSKDLPFSTVPRALIYDDIAQTYTISFKGTSFKPFYSSNDMLNISMLNAKFEPIWNKSVTFDGYIANMVKTDDNYFIYGAYQSLTDDNGKQYSTDAGNINMFIYPITAEGNWTKVTVFKEPFSYYPLFVSKINNEYVDIISVKDAHPDKLIQEKSVNAQPYYMIISANRSLYFAK